MKLLPLIFTAILFVSNGQADISIDTQIEQIMNGPANERVERMNQLKTKLAAMKEEERNEALQKLSAQRGKGGGHNGSNHLLNSPMHTLNPNSSAQRQMNGNGRPDFSNRP
ncbi:MAG: hypothetical protein M0P91_12285 [Sulfuricurvum sp.]|jgi:hypothetical protein|uniref:hypothetical protein n=1 Tax=Sulfuricurvum sp. TaxID=2025608 RepID=UPI0025DEB0F1|nr:hypothetical protein [Sulfuricurvum sp.]MCK9373964.1 hypothetical protein [Sulfuricurvum sp.]